MHCYLALKEYCLTSLFGPRVIIGIATWCMRAVRMLFDLTVIGSATLCTHTARLLLELMLDSLFGLTKLASMLLALLLGACMQPACCLTSAIGIATVHFSNSIIHVTTIYVTQL